MTLVERRVTIREDDPITIIPETLFGQVVSTPEDAAAIFEDPEVPDGTPVYVEDIDGGGNGGWVVNYGGSPIPTVFDDVPSAQSWIDTYPAPDGVTIWVDDTGDGGGGVVTTVDNVPIPTGPGSLETTCSGSTGVFYTIGAAAAVAVDTPDLATGADTSDLP